MGVMNDLFHSEQVLLDAYTSFHEVLSSVGYGSFSKNLGDVLFSMLVMNTISVETGAVLVSATPSAIMDDIVRLSEIENGRLIARIDQRMSEILGLPEGEIITRVDRFKNGRS